MKFSLAINFLIALLAIVNPVGKVPLWLKCVDDKPGGVRFWVAVMITATGAAVLLLFLLLGQEILSLFGIDLAAFKIGGGAIILLIAIRMVQGNVVNIDPDDDPDKQSSRLQAARVRFRQVVVPMAIPMIAGPGSISTAIIYSTKTNGMLTNATLAAVLLVVMACVLGVLLAGHRVRQWVGNTGLEIVTRLFGLILAGIAAQLIIEGLGEAFPAWIEPGSTIEDDLDRTGQSRES